MKFVDVKNDVAFHRIFGNANKTITLISFLNAVLQLEGTSRITWVKIENPYQFPLTTGGKISILDITAADQLGRKFVVEMQVADKEGFVKRTQYYAARDYSMQIESGEQYPLLRPTHFVGILNFNCTTNPNYFSHHGTIDLETGEHLLKDVQYFFIELLKFRKTINDLQTLMDKWVYFIKNAENLEMIPSGIKDEGLQTAYTEADKHNWSPLELKAYDDAGVRDADLVQERIFAENVGKEKGKVEGKAEAEAIAARDTEAMILEMKEEGMTIKQIAKITKKTEEEVSAIIEKHRK
jgi:predicted transposase/invertase (TIGR01784 family)